MQRIGRHSPGAHRTNQPTVNPIRNMHDILSDDFRRAVILILQGGDASMGLAEINEQLQEWSEDEDIAFERDATRSTKDHRHVLEEHVRKMADFGILEYDQSLQEAGIPDDVSFSLIPPWDTRSRTNQSPMRSSP